jgi:nucleoside-diphosphate-sugar epimerase
MPALRVQPQSWLLLGASGRIGRLLQAAWRVQPPVGAQIVASGRGEGGAIGPDALRWSLLAGPQPLLDHTARHGPIAGMLLFAGVTPASGADLEQNAALVEAALAAAMAAGIGRVLLASSSAVYGPGAALAESAPTRPASAYGAAKLRAEVGAEQWRARGLELCVLRIGNVAGADALFRNAGAGGTLQIDRFADGQGPTRSYIGPQTLARVLETLLRAPPPLPPLLNLAAPQPVTMSALAEAAGLDWRPVPAPAAAQQTVTLDCSALARQHAFVDADSEPVEMVAQLRRLKALP